MTCWPVKVQTEGCMHLNLNYSINYGGDQWSYIVNVRHIWWTSVMYDRRHILWMSIINEYDGCPSCMTYGCQSYMYDGYPSYLMYYSHKCPSFTWTSSVMEPMESFCRRNELKRFGEFWSTYMELMESEVREYREYGDDWIYGTGERETIDQGLDGIEWKD